MRGFTAIVGQSKVVQTLVTVLESGNIAHAYLFAGPRGTGKGTVADIFARALNCEAEVKPCDKCPSCKKALHQNHPDIIYVQPDGASIKIQQARQMQKMAYTKVYEGRRKVFIIDDAHKATIQASNSLLKLLEEPPENVVFILLSDNCAAIPATVLSRCQRVNFSQMDKKEIGRLLVTQGFTREKAQLAAAVSGGSFGEALKIVNDESLGLVREQAVNFLQAAFSRDYFRVYKLIDVIDKEKTDIAQLLRQILLLLKDIYIRKLGGPEELIVNIDILAALQAVNINQDKLNEGLDLVEKAVEYQRRQANTKLLLDTIGVGLAKLA